MINLKDIQSASGRISSFIIKTPLERSQTLTNILGANTYLKMELFQKTGSFKPRGAFNQILQLDGKARDKGVVAVSGGNFAQGVAYAASKLGIQAIICMPEYTPPNYVEATKSYGARVELSPDFPSTFAKAQTFKEDGYAFLHAWDNSNQMAGNGTIGLEIIVVSDQEAVEDQRFLLERTKVLTELAASCTLSAARKIRQQFQRDDNVVLLLCGGNESLSNMIGYLKTDQA